MPDKLTANEVLAMVRIDALTAETPFGVATPDAVTSRGFCGQRMLWIPDHAQELKQRMLIWAHTKEVDHRGVGATLERLQEYCVWASMEDGAKEGVPRLSAS